MGYYMGVSGAKSKKYFGGGKFFGYLEDEDYFKTESYKFIKSIEPEIAENINILWLCPTLVLTANEFLQFMIALTEDLRRFTGLSLSQYFSDYAIYDFIRTDEFKIIEWG